MQTDMPDSMNPKFRLRVASSALALSALLGALHGQAVSEAEASRAEPRRLIQSDPAFAVNSGLADTQAATNSRIAYP